MVTQHKMERHNETKQVRSPNPFPKPNPNPNPDPNPNPNPNPNPIPDPNLDPILIKDKRKATFLEHALLGKTQAVEQLELTLKNAHNDNVAAKREAKKLLRQAHDSPNPCPPDPHADPNTDPDPILDPDPNLSLSLHLNPPRLNSIESDKAKAEASQAKADRETDSQKVSFISF